MTQHASLGSVEKRAAEGDSVPVAALAEDRPNVYVLASGATVLLFRRGGQITAFGDVCPHMGGDLGEGRYCEKTGTLGCRWHGYRFSIDDGRFVENPNEGPLAVLRVPSKHYRPDRQPPYRLRPVSFEIRGDRVHFGRERDR
jgi:nitrite reductase/ring-hydroxylating ferredoxin subunit